MKPIINPLRPILAGAALATALLCASGASADPREVLGIVTGPATGTYVRIGEDIAKVGEKAGLKIEVKESGGAIDNIKRVNSNENAALGIVQSDVLGFLKRSKNPESMKVGEHLRMVFPLYREEVHLLARNDVRTLSDLNGKRVAVGEDGSGSWLTAMNLFQLMGITPREVKRIPQPDAVLGVLKKDVDAMIFVGGKPLQLFKNLENLKGQTGGAEMLKQVHFVAIDDPRILREYDKGEINHADYSFVDQPVPTISVASLMMSYDFGERKDAYGKRRCAMLGQMTRAVRDNLEALRASGHPKWKEINLDADVTIWQRDACAGRNPTVMEDSVSKPLERELFEVIRDKKSGE